MRSTLPVVVAISALTLGCGGGGGEHTPPAADSTAPAGPRTDASPAESRPVPAPGDPSGPTADTTGSWSDPPIVRERPDVHALLTAARTARHDAYDRIVFEFDGAVPGYAIRYIEDPVACGSGNSVDTGAPASLEVELRSAAAHDEAGAITVREREMNPDHPVLRTAWITCDFEGVVAWVLGVDRRAPIRVLELSSPARLVIDLRHR